MTPELTILMPCLDEEKTIAFCINEAKRFIDESGISAEIVIADNGSTDRSADIAASLGARVVNVPEKGYGNALPGRRKNHRLLHKRSEAVHRRKRDIR